MVGSVSGSQQNQQIDPLQSQNQTGAVNKADTVSQGFDQENSISHRTGGGLVQLPPGTSYSPSLPLPGQANATPEQMQHMATQTKASELRGEMFDSFLNIESNNPALATEEVRNQLQMIDSKLSRLSNASPEVMSGIQTDIAALKQDSIDGTLTADKLEEILTQLNAKFEDNSVKFAENKIKIESEEKIRQAESNVKNWREDIEKANENKGLFALKIVAAILFPPLGAWEAGRAISREIHGQDTGLSMFSSNAANKQAANNVAQLGTQQYWDNLGNALGGETGTPPVNSNQGAVHPNDTPESTPTTTTSVTDESSPTKTGTEGIVIAEGGMTQADFMKLLKQQQEAEENKEKLDEAIAALESGDVEGAAKILGASVDELGLGSSLGDSMTTEPDTSDTTPEIPNDEPEIRDQGDTDQRLPEDSGPESTSDLPPQPPNSFNNFLDQLSQVPQTAQENLQSGIQEQGLISRRNAV